jgi:transcriptional accessory protein Tex/SPT6
MVYWLRQKIFDVLKRLRIDHEDIPYITTYQKQDFVGLPPGYTNIDTKYQLDEDSVYKIFNLDQEWAKFSSQKQSFQRILGNMV